MWIATMIIFVLKAGRDADGLRVNRPTGECGGS